MKLVALLLLAALCQDTSKKLKVGVYADGGALRKSVDLTKKALESKFDVEEFTAKDDLGKFDVLVFPGGSGGGQSKSLGKEGKDKVAAHLARGKGVIGICAGAYLMLKDGGMPLVNGVLVDGDNWARGTGRVEIQITKSDVFPKTTRYAIHYENGPLMKAGKGARVLATFVSDFGKIKGAMPGTAAVLAAEYGKGRIVLFSPHPEESNLEELLHQAARWVARR